jgi:hypothetical protein
LKRSPWPRIAQIERFLSFQHGCHNFENRRSAVWKRNRRPVPVAMAQI